MRVSVKQQRWNWKAGESVGVGGPRARKELIRASAEKEAALAHRIVALFSGNAAVALPTIQ